MCASEIQAARRRCSPGITIARAELDRLHDRIGALTAKAPLGVISPYHQSRHPSLHNPDMF
jgi:hypothetical protein